MRYLSIVVLGCLLVLGYTVTEAQTADHEPEVVNAVDGLLAAFDSYPIVAIGEQHGIQQLGDLYQAILRDPRFAEKVDAVVLEYGNARYQDMIDRYMNGEDIPYRELQRVWSDAVAKIPGGTEVMYEQLFVTLRAINQTLPEGERIRVLLGDPPIDWSVIQSREEVIPFQLQRESHFAEVVIREVLDKGLTALVIIGGPHLDRSPITEANLPADISSTSPALAGANMIPLQIGVMQQLVEARYPGKTFVALVHTGFVEDTCNADIEQRMSSWETPSLAYVRGSWLETITCTKYPAPIFVNPNGTSGNQMMGAPDGQLPENAAVPSPPPASPIPQADAYLYVGKRDDLTMSPFDPIIYLDPDYFSELSRRHEMMLGEPLNWETVSRDNPRYYTDNFPAP